MTPTLEQLMAMAKIWCIAYQGIGSTYSAEDKERMLDHAADKRADLESTLRTLLARLVEAEADRDALRGFAQQLLGELPDVGEDGFALQEYALKFGLLEQKMPPPTEPCGEGCNCAGYFDRDEWVDGVICYRKTARLKG